MPVQKTRRGSDRCRAPSSRLPSRQRRAANDEAKSRLGLAVRDFTLREDPPHEAIAVPLDHVRDALDFSRIQPDTYNLHPPLDPTDRTARPTMHKTLPAVPASFYWTDEPWGPALRCRPLEPIAQQPLYDPTTAVTVPRTRGGSSRLRSASPWITSSRWTQVHGREVVIVSEERRARDTATNAEGAAARRRADFRRT